MPPITELTWIEPVHLERLERQGTFTTGLLLERSETTTRRQYLADQVDATTNDVLMWRDEALMLNLASFGPADHQLLIQAGIEGLPRHPVALAGRLPRPHRGGRDRAQRGAPEPSSPSRAGGCRRGPSRTNRPGPRRPSGRDGLRWATWKRSEDGLHPS